MTKEQLDLPIYRGKSIKTKQYVEGYLKPCADTGANIYIGYRQKIGLIIR